jgi:hypothetical protein
VGGLGLSKQTVSVVPRLGFEVEPMEHHYLLNPDIAEFKLVGKADQGKRELDPATKGLSSLREVAADALLDIVIEDFVPESITPLKTNAYLYNRFVMHPLFKYRMFAVTYRGRVAGLLVTRTVSALGVKAMQIVDYLGHDNGLIGIGHALVDLIRESNVEFIDLYSHGVGEAELAASGMIPHRAADPVVIPLYFDPFEKDSHDLDCCIVALEGVTYRVFKGDSDQDRPNRLLSGQNGT